MRKAIILAVLFLAPGCLADTFQIDGILTSPYTGGTVGQFAGWIAINTGTGVITNWNVQMPDIPAGLNEPMMSAFTFSPSFSTFDFSSSQGQLKSFSQFFDLYFTISNNTLVGFSGSAFNGGYGDPRSQPGAFYIASGTITPGPAPEPSTWLLMGSGLLGVVFLRLKLVRAG